MTDKYDERAKKIIEEYTGQTFYDFKVEEWLEGRIAAALRNAVAEAVIEALLDITKGITKIMDQTMAAEYIKAKKQAKAEAYADAAKIADGIICTGAYADGTFSICNKEIAADIRARAQEVAG